MQKKKGIVGKIIQAVLFLAAFLIAVSFFIKKENGLTYTGIGIYTVLTGSMSPTFDAGSVIIVREIKPEDIMLHDIITFKASTDSNVMVTHRVIKINNDGGNYEFITKGDANDVKDFTPVTAERIVGRVVYAIPKLGAMTSTLRPVIYGVVIVLVVLLLWPDKKKKGRKKGAPENAGPEAAPDTEETGRSEQPPPQAELAEPGGAANADNPAHP